MMTFLFVLVLLSAAIVLGQLTDSDALDLPPLLTIFFALGPVFLMMLLCFARGLPTGGYALLGLLLTEGFNRGRLLFALRRALAASARPPKDDKGKHEK